MRNICCGAEEADSYGDCDAVQKPSGDFSNQVFEFAKSEESWLNWYTKAWTLATQNGHEELSYLDGTTRPDLICKAYTNEDACAADVTCDWKEYTG